MKEIKTGEELLKPRIKVIAPFPLMKNEVGSYLERNESSNGYSFAIKTNNADHFYPLEVFKSSPCFKESSWWEDRRPEEMPMYVKSEDYAWRHHYKIGENGKLYFNEEANGRPIGWLPVDGVFNLVKPATKYEFEYVQRERKLPQITQQEYENYINGANKNLK